MNRQRGLALSALLLWGVVIALVSIVVIRIMPEAIEYYKIRRAVNQVASEAVGKTVPEIRQAFGKQAEVDHLSAVSSADLDVYKESNKIVIAFAYEKRIPLVGNVSLVIDFSGSSSARDVGQ
ncbi:MAG: DUF4845 domain-containing protein [Gammaproteobacteria bacterium]|nr:MAG: DUF4845 domain-containing protein [Gammaproteobacteria bacterium]